MSTKPTPAQRARVLANLTREVPAPVKLPPKPRAAWDGRKVGTRMVDPQGLVWEVVACDTDGATLRNVLGRGLVRFVGEWKAEGWAPERKRKPPKAKEPSHL